MGTIKCIVGRGLVGGFGGLFIAGPYGAVLGLGGGVYSCVRKKSVPQAPSNGGQ